MMYADRRAHEYDGKLAEPSDRPTWGFVFWLAVALIAACAATRFVR